MTFQTMPDTTPPGNAAKLLADADNLIQRRRVFIASPSLCPPPSVSTHDTVLVSAPSDETTIQKVVTKSAASIRDDDFDLPLLTEEVTSLTPSLEDLQASQRAAVQKELTRWLEQDLPLTILKITDGIADQLLGEITHKVKEYLLPNLMTHLGDPPSDA